MDNRTTASAHIRLDKVETNLGTHEAVCAERWKETILRIKRIETVMISASAGIIALLVSVLLKVT
jgi:hypothetical protein|tara:strand:- start:1392 stop:1586 length:195 start_codon:yes stop_codon:yes gene_type:complete